MFSALLGCLFPGHLARERRLFLGLFGLCPRCFQVSSFFSSKSVIYEAKIKNLENSLLCHSLGLISLAGLPSSLCFSKSSYVYFIYNVQGF